MSIISSGEESKTRCKKSAAYLIALLVRTWTGAHWHGTLISTRALVGVTIIGVCLSAGMCDVVQMRFVSVSASLHVCGFSCAHESTSRDAKHRLHVSLRCQQKTHHSQSVVPNVTSTRCGKRSKVCVARINYTKHRLSVICFAASDKCHIA